MNSLDWTEVETLKAQEIWAAYEKQHDLSEQIGRTAGIDPQSGRIWVGASIREVVLQRKREGFSSPLFFQRIGSPTYYRKGSHQ